MKLKVMTFNIHKGFTVGNLKFTLPGMREAINSVNPDIVLLQEVQGRHKFFEKTIASWPEEASQADYLAKKKFPHVIYSENVTYNAGGHGNAIISKHPFVMTENINVAHSDSASRSVLHATIKHPETGQNVHFICLHFGLFKAERREQLDLLSRRIAEHVPDGETVIVGGDFNDWLQHAATYLETENKMTEVFMQANGEYAKSFPVYQPLLTLDRLYYRNAKPLHYAVLYTPPWNKLSDHAPLYTEFEI